MSMRRVFVHALFEGLYILRPVLSLLLAFITAVGGIVGLVEGWGFWRGVYFGFITALTIGYGDFAPTRPPTQAPSILPGFAGVAMAALLAGVTVRALQVSRERLGKN